MIVVGVVGGGGGDRSCMLVLAPLAVGASTLGPS